MNDLVVEPDAVIKFWFAEIETKFWWVKDAEFDQQIADRFEATHHLAIQGKLSSWRTTPLGRLAEIIVLDQFSRNIHRNSPLAFAYDDHALVLVQDAIHVKADQELEPGQRAFLYMPLMHSEIRGSHEIALTLFKAPGMETNLDFELKHKAIIDRFGRYPHRNAILGRQSTPEEIEFLKNPDSSF